MLTSLFLLAAVVLVASVVRRPTKTWQRAVVVLAVIVLVAVMVAWGIEYVMQSENVT